MRLRLSCLLLVVTSGCGPRLLNVTMNPDNNSGQSGFAVITDRGSKGITVTVETNAPDVEGTQPAHIHTGNCGEVGMIVGSLSPPGMNPLAAKPGRYGLTLDLSMTFDTFSKGDWALNVHDSRDHNVYVSCGDIPKP